MQSGQAPSFGTTAIVYAVAIALLVWRMARPQRLSVLRLCVIPGRLARSDVFSVSVNNYASVMAGHAPAPNWEIAGIRIIGAALGIPLGSYEDAIAR